jgi:hypothetical protein
MKIVVVMAVTSDGDASHIYGAACGPLCTPRGSLSICWLKFTKGYGGGGIADGQRGNARCRGCKPYHASFTDLCICQCAASERNSCVFA